MGAAAIKNTKVKEHFGSIVTGIDLAQPIDAATQKKLYDATVENVVLVFHNQQRRLYRMLVRGDRPY